MAFVPLEETFRTSNTTRLAIAAIISTILIIIFLLTIYPLIENYSSFGWGSLFDISITGELSLSVSITFNLFNIQCKPKSSSSSCHSKSSSSRSSDKGIKFGLKIKITLNITITLSFSFGIYHLMSPNIEDLISFFQGMGFTFSCILIIALTFYIVLKLFNIECSVKKSSSSCH